MNFLLILTGVILIIVGVIRLANDKGHDPSDHISLNNKQSNSEYINSVSTTTESTDFNSSSSDMSVSAHQPTDPKEVGNQFEDYVANLFKNRDVFTVLEWNQGQTSSQGVYAESDKKPDFKIQQKVTDKFPLTYWIECKYRHSFDTDDNIKINQYQLNRYRTHQRENRQKVILAIGIGGTPSTPDKFYLMPLDSISDENVNRALLSKFLIKMPLAETQSHIERYFFEQVFPASKSRKGPYNKK